MKNANFLNLGKSASYLGTYASNLKMEARFVIIDLENPWIAVGKKFLGWQWQATVYIGIPKILALARQSMIVVYQS